MEIKAEHKKFVENISSGNRYTLKDTENRSKTRLYILAVNDIKVIKVDDGIIGNNNIKKCDYLTKSDICINFIELKGTKIDDAFEQIKNTISYLNNDYYHFLLKTNKAFAIIVSPIRQQIPAGINRKEKHLAVELAKLNHSKQNNILDYVKYVTTQKHVTKAKCNGRKLECSGENPLKIE